MSDVISFPSSSPPKNMHRTPAEALNTVLDALEDGSTTAEQMIITWACQNEGALELRYIVAGEESMTSAVGLLEVTKNALLGP